jgi:hypothetical protein
MVWQDRRCTCNGCSSNDAGYTLQTRQTLMRHREVDAVAARTTAAAPRAAATPTPGTSTSPSHGRKRSASPSGEERRSDDELARAASSDAGDYDNDFGNDDFYYNTWEEDDETGTEPERDAGRGDDPGRAGAPSPFSPLHPLDPYGPTGPQLQEGLVWGSSDSSRRRSAGVIFGAILVLLLAAEFHLSKRALSILAFGLTLFAAVLRDGALAGVEHGDPRGADGAASGDGRRAKSDVVEIPLTTPALQRLLGIHTAVVEYPMCPHAPCSTLFTPFEPPPATCPGCGTAIIRPKTALGKRCAVKRLAYRPVVPWLFDLLRRPGFVDALTLPLPSDQRDLETAADDPGVRADASTGLIWRLFGDSGELPADLRLDPDGTVSFSQPTYRRFAEHRCNLQLMLTVDWFDSSDRRGATGNSIGVALLYLKNLPRAIRNREENVLPVCIIPGPTGDNHHLVRGLRLRLWPGSPAGRSLKSSVL